MSMHSMTYPVIFLLLAIVLIGALYAVVRSVGDRIVDSDHTADPNAPARRRLSARRTGVEPLQLRDTRIPNSRNRFSRQSRSHGLVAISTQGSTRSSPNSRTAPWHTHHRGVPSRTGCAR